LRPDPSPHGREDIRWQQRFVHFRKAFELLGQAVAIEEPSDTERAGMILFFEMTFELAWKMLKDYLEGQGLGETGTVYKILLGYKNLT
jgi:Nucleotidyltransferase substrate binding protein like